MIEKTNLKIKEKNKFKQISKEDWFHNLYQNYLKSNKTICPVCEHKLEKRYEGLACRNFKCPLYFKLESGWVYLTGESKNNLDYFKDKYNFDIDNFENKKRWLKLKDEVLNEKGRKCEICKSETSLHVHHIVYRTEAPALTFDKENLIVLCEICHKKIHKNDKRAFR